MRPLLFVETSSRIDGAIRGDQRGIAFFAGFGVAVLHADEAGEAFVFLTATASAHGTTVSFSPVQTLGLTTVTAMITG